MLMSLLQKRKRLKIESSEAETRFFLGFFFGPNTMDNFPEKRCWHIHTGVPHSPRKAFKNVHFLAE